MFTRICSHLLFPLRVDLQGALNSKNRARPGNEAAADRMAVDSRKVRTSLSV